MVALAYGHDVLIDLDDLVCLVNRVLDAFLMPKTLRISPHKLVQACFQLAPNHSYYNFVGAQDVVGSVLV